MNITKRILIVDDEEASKINLEYIFKKINYNPEITFIQNTDTLKTMLHDMLSRHYDLIFMDREIYWWNTDDIVASLIIQNIETPIISISSEKKQIQNFWIIPLLKTFKNKEIELLINQHNDWTLLNNRQAWIITRANLVFILQENEKYNQINNTAKSIKKPRRKIR